VGKLLIVEAPFYAFPSLVGLTIYCLEMLSFVCSAFSLEFYSVTSYRLAPVLGHLSGSLFGQLILGIKITPSE
jgi:hypothetical protein